MDANKRCSQLGSKSRLVMDVAGHGKQPSRSEEETSAAISDDAFMHTTPLLSSRSCWKLRLYEVCL